MRSRQSSRLVRTSFRFAQIGMRQVAAREDAVAEIVERQLGAPTIGPAGEELLMLKHDPVELVLLQPNRLRREEVGARSHGPE